MNAGKWVGIKIRKDILALEKSDKIKFKKKSKVIIRAVKGVFLAQPASSQ